MLILFEMPLQMTILLMAETVKNLPVMQETRVQSLGQEDSPGEGNGNPLQYSCLENPMDRGAWSSTVHGSKESDMTEWLTLSLLNVDLSEYLVLLLSDIFRSFIPTRKICLKIK